MKKQARRPPDDLFVPERAPKRVPHAFVLDALAPLDPYTRPMFGCLAVYVEDRIVAILRDQPGPVEDNGVWVATTREHHASLRAELPSLRSIGVLGPGETGWQVVPADAPDFEEAALRVTDLVLARDPRIGKIPKPRRPKRPGEAGNAKTRAKTAKKTTPKGTVRSRPRRAER